MKEIFPKDYARIVDLYHAPDIHLAVSAVLTSTPQTNGLAARVFVDSASRPRCALIWIQHRFYLAGAPDNATFNRDLARLLTQQIFPAQPHDGFVLYYADPAWEDALTHAVLPGHPPIPNPREYYELDTQQWVYSPLPLPEGFTLQPLDRALTQDTRLRNLDDLLEEMYSERPTIDDFLDHSFGTILTADGCIVTWVLSEYNLDERCEVGIATHPAYQRRGLAALAGRAFVEQARQSGIRRIGWHCWTNNTASGRVALKIGFRKVQDVPACLVLSDPLLNLAVHGDVLNVQGDYAGAAAWFERAFAAGDPPGWSYLGAACAQTMLGNQEKAFAYLYQAVDRGFADPQHLGAVQCLDGLKSTPQWTELITTLCEQA